MEEDDSPELVPESSVVVDIVDDLKTFPENNNFEADAPSSAGRGNYESAVLWPSYCNPTYIMPDKIDVKVTVGADTYYFPLDIEKATAPKKYLGGYRNKLNGYVYHHASSQTPTDQKKILRDYTNLRTRETQTSEMRTLSVQPQRESGTQMERIDLCIDNKRDTVKYPRVYFTADELLLKKKINLIEIQRCWRGHMARNRAKQIRQRNVDFALAMEKDRLVALLIYLRIAVAYLLYITHSRWCFFTSYHILVMRRWRFSVNSECGTWPEGRTRGATQTSPCSTTNSTPGARQK